MELLQLKYYVTVAKYENMTAAAKELCVAQPAISQSISRLEEDLGVQLFTREGRRIKLNACGKHLSTRITSILTSLDNLKFELSEIAEHSSSCIRLKILSASSLLPSMLSAFQQIFPQISFRLIQNPAETDYDLCINSTASLKNSLDTVLLDEEILLAVPRKHSYQTDSSIKLTDLKNEGFVSLRKGLTFRSIMDDYCDSIRFVPNIIFESDSPATVRGLISTGVGIAFWPARSWGPLADEETLLHISDLYARRVVTLTSPEGKVMSKATRIFAAFAVDFFKKL